jgi:hypothetical protein
MPPLKKDPNSEFVKEIFMALLDRWDVKDRLSAKNLALHAQEIAAGYNDIVRPPRSISPGY